MKYMTMEQGLSLMETKATSGMGSSYEQVDAISQYLNCQYNQ